MGQTIYRFRKDAARRAATGSASARKDIETGSSDRSSEGKSGGLSVRVFFQVWKMIT